MNKAVLDTQNVRFTDAGSIYSPWFQPGAAKFGDVAGLLKLGKGSLWKKGEPGAKPESPIDAALAD